MGKLDSLKITEAPLAFASFAAKHNALCDLLAGMVGENGISVVIAEKNAIIRGNVTANGNVVSTGGITMENVYSNLNANVANLVRHDGLLANAYVANANIGTYPSIGKFVTASGNVVIDSVGVVITKSDGKICNIAFATLTQNMSIQNVQVCSNGNTKSMLVIASAPY